MNYKKNKKGFTLIELMVSVFIFSLLVGGIVNILVASISLQRRIMAEQKMFSDVSFVLEYMSRTLRMARKDIAGTCVGLRNHNYIFPGGVTTTIRFLNFDGQCQEFSLSGGAISERIAPEASAAGLPAFITITSRNVIVESMVFGQAGSAWHSPATNQSRVVMALVVQPRGGGTVTRFQTVISQRQLNVVY